MADTDSLLQALELAAKSGDLGAAKAISTDLQRMRERAGYGLPEQVRLGTASLKENAADIAKGSTPTEQVFGGAGAGMIRAGEGLKGIVGQSDPANLAATSGIQSATPYTMGGNLGGQALAFGLGPIRGGAALGTLGAKAFGHEAPAWLGSRAVMAGDTAGTSGAVNAAVEPENRFSAALMGAGAAGIAPAVYGAGAGVRRMASSGGRQIDVGERLRGDLGSSKADQLAEALLSQDPQARLGAMSSGAALTRDPGLQVLETGSRAKRSDLWQPFDTQNANARWAALNTQAGTRGELQALENARNTATGDLRTGALTKAQLSTIFSQSGDIDIHLGNLEPMLAKIDQFRVGTLRPNKDVQTLANYLEGELKQGVTPEQLYEIRKTLTDGIKAGRNDELSNAIKSARVQRLEMVREIDNTLDQLSGGSWGKYLSEYADASKPINSKQALQDIVSDLSRGQPAGAVPPVMGQSPGWKTVGTLRDRYGQKELGSKTFDRLLPEDRQHIELLIDGLKGQADSMQAKGILGSQTAALLANMGRGDAVTRGAVGMAANKAMPYVGSILSSKMFDAAGRKAEEELARLLQNPQALAEALARAKQAQALGRGMSRAGAMTGAAIE